MSDRFGAWKPYVPVAQRRAQAERETRKLNKAGSTQPVRIQGRAIASSFWGKGWCTQLEAFSDFENRLPRGRSYVRNGSVCHLEVKAGRIEARVMGSSLYQVTVDIHALKPAAWSAVKQKCAGEIGSLLELLQGRLSGPVMKVVADRDAGLFPKAGEMRFDCSCPDGAYMCKHVAATLYGVGHRLDQQPQLLFLLRGVDAAELIDAGFSAPKPSAGPVKGRLAEAQLGAIFGVELDEGGEGGAVQVVAAAARAPASKTPARKTAPARAAAAAGFRATARTIAGLRRKLGFSVAEFAEALSVSPASVLRWEAAGGPLKLQARCLAALEKLQRPALADKSKTRSRPHHVS
jgi:DNA-binding transcriptional regulator YiaG